MRLTLKLGTLLTLSSIAACASPPRPVVLTPGPITCPQSLQQAVEPPDRLDQSFFFRLSEEDQRYIADYISQYNAALNQANSKADDALNSCADYNRNLHRLQSGGNLGG